MNSLFVLSSFPYKLTFVVTCSVTSYSGLWGGFGKERVVSDSQMNKGTHGLFSELKPRESRSFIVRKISGTSCHSCARSIREENDYIPEVLGESASMCGQEPGESVRDWILRGLLKEARI